MSVQIVPDIAVYVRYGKCGFGKLPDNVGYVFPAEIAFEHCNAYCGDGVSVCVAYRGGDTAEKCVVLAVVDRIAALSCLFKLRHD